ncbi:DUF6541 family protein [Microbacterium hominis]|uniref:Uncharacterized protein n=1 Tax=Microbacterium hominis TaxID=162426 RepID=A0A7D4Q1U1_9MICO|nr:DUF6541 family protein [Microbacterium hominis]QKJ20032.1 hypothetical protein HQM25_12150 [Microbacterium hominis]
MIGDWVVQAPVLLVALAVVFGPGLLIGAGLRLRGLALWALAPVASTAVIALLALGYEAVGIPWTSLSILIGLAGAAAVAWAFRLVLGAPARRPAADPRGRTLVLAGLAVGVLLCAARLVVYVNEPDAISQTNDAVFHLNALRWILETGSASSLTVSGVIGGSGFYPAAWHALTSATMLLTGAEIPVAANMMSLVVAAAIWPVGLAWFTRTVVGGRVGPTAIAAALAGSLHAFPMLMFQWGILYSYSLSLALLPAVAALVIGAPAWLSGEGPVTGRARSAVLLAAMVLAGLGAIALSQPAVLLAWALLCATWFAWWAGRRLRDAARRERTVLITALAAVLVGVAVLWIVLSRSTSGSHWPPFRGKVAVLADVLLNAPVLLPPALGVSILMVIGLVVAVRRPPLRWLAVVWLAFAGLYALCAAVGNPLVRRYALGAWYADPYRLAAMLPLVVLPLAAIGLSAVATWAVARISKREADSAERVATGWSVAAVGAFGTLALVLAPVIQMPAVTENSRDAESRFVTEDYLSPDERTLIERLDETIADDATVIGNPATGMGFGYMLSGEDVSPRTWATPLTSDWTVLGERLRDAGTDPEVCDALAVYGDPEYVLDFGEGEPGPGRYVYAGMADFAGQPGFELVDSEGEASLWRITACAP